MSDKLLEKFLHELTTEYSHIRPMEEDDDAIEKSGLEAFKAGDFQLAEKRFKELAVSQPSHHSGLEYLALLYSRTGKFELAAAIQEEAIKIAKRFLEDDSIDVEVIEEMEENLNKVKEGKEIQQWWK